MNDAAHRVGIALFCLALPVLCQGCAWPFASQKGPQFDEIAEQAARKSPEKWETKDLKPDHLELARDLVAGGLYKAALVQLEMADKGGASGCEILYLRGTCRLGLNMCAEAREDFTKAISIDSKYAPSYNGLGLVYDREGLSEAAWESYTKAIELNPARADFHCNLGYSKLKAGRYKEAERHFLDCLALNRDFKAAQNNLALCYGLQKRYADALALLLRNASQAEAYNNLGALYEMNGDRESAVRCYKEALRIDHSLSQAMENLANCNVAAVPNGQSTHLEEPL
jgi:Flp pilus assembly protein TadD